MSKLTATEIYDLKKYRSSMPPKKLESLFTPGEVERFPLTHAGTLFHRTQQLLAAGHRVKLHQTIECYVLTYMPSLSPLQFAVPVEPVGQPTAPVGETYQTAKERIIDQFVAAGFQYRQLVPEGAYRIILSDEWSMYFRVQSLYLGQYSLFTDIRWLHAATVLTAVDMRLGTRFSDRLKQAAPTAAPSSTAAPGSESS